MATLSKDKTVYVRGKSQGIVHPVRGGGWLWVRPDKSSIPARTLVHLKSMIAGRYKISEEEVNLVNNIYQ